MLTTAIKKISVVFFMAGLCQGGWASADEVLSRPLDPEKIRKASALASRVLDRTGDAQGALQILQEVSITRLLDEKPPGFSMDVYTEALSVYANVLFQLPDRYAQAESIANRVIKYRPDEYPMYLLMGDVQQKHYKLKPNAESAARAKQYYQQYVDALQAKKLQAVLPDRVMQAVYSLKHAEICSFVKQLLVTGQADDLSNFFRAETAESILPRDASGTLPAFESGLTFSEFANSDASPVYRSRVDIDNDGRDEIRYRKKVESSGCTRNLFYKSAKEDPKKKSFMSNALLDTFFKGDKLCGESDLQFIRFSGVNYFLEKNQLSRQLSKYNIHRLSPQGIPQNLCSLDIRAALPLDIQTDCDAAVCKKLVTIAGDVIASQGEGGIEKQIEQGMLPQFGDSVLQDATLAKYATSPHLYFVDLDNDGKEEMISRLWEKTGNGEVVFSYRLFRQVDEVWQALLLPEGVVDTGQAEHALDFATWFFVEPYEGKNFIVVYRAFRKTLDEQSFMEYEMLVYLYEGAKFGKIGRIAIKDLKTEK